MTVKKRDSKQNARANEKALGVEFSFYVALLPELDYREKGLRVLRIRLHER